MLEFQVGDYTYRARKLDTFKQMHVLKRIGPPFIKLIRESMEGTVRPEDVGADPNLLEMQRFMQAMHEMSDEEVDFVVTTCAAVVQRLVSTNGTPVWGPIFEPRAKAFMFEDLQNLGDIIQITGRVVQDNLAGFLSIKPPETGQVLPTRPTLAASNM